MRLQGIAAAAFLGFWVGTLRAADAPKDLRDAVGSVLPIVRPAVFPPPSRAIYREPAASVEARVEDLLARMTLDEKIALLSGVNGMDLPANARLGIPALKMTDGPLGVRVETGEKTTAFPAGILSASSFDPDLLGRVAAAMGVETLALGRDMLLGPCVNITRAPQGGRNFESFGEDPYLAARMAASWVTGLQSKKVLASTKHFALNNQETERMTVNVRAGERAIHEIFLPAFLAAVRAGTWTVMAAYNKINGPYASENDYLLNEVLKRRWGFRGFVVSDWGATHSTTPAANGGLDVEMPSGEFFGAGKLQAAVREGGVTPGTVDDKARRVLRAMIGGGVFDRKAADRPARSAVNSPEHQALALKMAQEGIVLLANDGILPLEPGKIKSVAVLGPSAAEYRAGGGSSEVPAAHVVTALDGLKARAGAGVTFRYVGGVRMPGELRPIEASWLTPPPGKGEGHGLYTEYFTNKKLEGKPFITQIDPPVNFDWGDAAPWKGMPVDNFSIRWTGRLRVPETRDYEIAARSDDGVRLWVDGKLVLEDWSDHGPVTHSAKLRLEAGKDYDLKLEYYENSGGAMVRLGWMIQTGGDIQAAAEAARTSDAAVVFVGASDQLEGEGQDRQTLELPAGQERLIDAVAKANKNVVVVLQVGSPVLVGRWAEKVRAVVSAWYPGEEGGLAIADVLLGKVNPSGKTPVTWPKSREDSPDFGNFPGKAGNVDYAEGLYVGYRHFDKRGIEPMYPFGHGLSYTTFAVSNLTVKVVDGSAASPDVEISAEVRNTGARRGTEVAQLYVRDESPKVDRPEQELKGFARVDLAPGERKTVTFRLGKDAFAFYDDKAHDWALPPGRFSVRVAGSSRDIQPTRSFELK